MHRVQLYHAPLFSESFPRAFQQVSIHRAWNPHHGSLQSAVFIPCLLFLEKDAATQVNHDPKLMSETSRKSSACLILIKFLKCCYIALFGFIICFYNTLSIIQYHLSLWLCNSLCSITGDKEYCWHLHYSYAH
jgi:hypothetical protein